MKQLLVILFALGTIMTALNKDKNPDFNMLIRDLDYLKFITNTKSRENDGGKTEFRSLDKRVMGEGFENIMSIDNKDYVLHLYLLAGDGSDSHWVATFFMEGMTGVMEMKGELDTKYIHAFSSLNFEQVKDMLSLEEDNDIFIDVD